MTGPQLDPETRHCLPARQITKVLDGAALLWFPASRGLSFYTRSDLEFIHKCDLDSVHLGLWGRGAVDGVQCDTRGIRTSLAKLNCASRRRIRVQSSNMGESCTRTPHARLTLTGNLAFSSAAEFQSFSRAITAVPSHLALSHLPQHTPDSVLCRYLRKHLPI